MTNPLLISRKENAGILRKICSEIGATPREISGDEWSLALFIKTDLKNYMYQSHYVLDVSAFLEKGDDLVALCEGIALQKDPNSISYMRIISSREMISWTSWCIRAYII